MNLAHRLTYHAVTGGIKGLTGLLCDLDTAELDKVPGQGPLIVYLNHVNFLDVPLIYTRLLPRPVTGFAKSETWDDPLLGPLFTMWGAIPLHRGEADTAALRRGLQVLEKNQILGITPEGTRSGSGVLQYAHPGVVTIALHSDAPLLPVALWGQEAFHGNFRKMRRTKVNFRVGNQLRIDLGGQRPRSDVRQAVVDELMCNLAALLPLEYRGVYADLPREYRFVKPVSE